MIDVQQLDKELKAAGLFIFGCSSVGRIDWVNPPSAQDLQMAQWVLTTHDPTKRQRDEDAERAQLKQLASTWDTLTQAQKMDALKTLFIRLSRNL